PGAVRTEWRVDLVAGIEHRRGGGSAEVTEGPRRSDAHKGTARRECPFGDSDRVRSAIGDVADFRGAAIVDVEHLLTARVVALGGVEEERVVTRTGVTGADEDGQHLRRDLVEIAGGGLTKVIPVTAGMRQHRRRVDLRLVIETRLLKVRQDTSAP